MKTILCTLAVCLSVFAAVLTLEEAIRTEGKRIRAGIPKALVEPLDKSQKPESVAQKLDAINAQLNSLSRRLSQLESPPARQGPALPQGQRADPLSPEFRALAASLRAASDSLNKLGGVPAQLAELTAFIDRSFGHVETRLNEKALPEEMLNSIDWLVQSTDNIDRYFTPLFSFLGLVYDPASDDLIRAYPSLDSRLNTLAADLESLKRAVADIRSNMMVPTVIEPRKYERP